jgi:hypothetical protein
VEITPELFEQQRSRRFGNANPESMRFALWEWSVKDHTAHASFSK